MLRVVDEATQIDLGNRKGTIVIEADTREEADGTRAVQLAIEESNRRSLLGAAVSNRHSAYAVHADGTPITDPTQGMPHGAKFRVDISVRSGM